MGWGAGPSLWKTGDGLAGWGRQREGMGRIWLGAGVIGKELLEEGTARTERNTRPPFSAVMVTVTAAQS